MRLIDLLDVLGGRYDICVNIDDVDEAYILSGDREALRQHTPSKFVNAIIRRVDIADDRFYINAEVDCE